MGKAISQKELLKKLNEDGWYYYESNGSSHNQYKHSTKKGKVTVKSNIPVYCGWLLSSMERQSGIKF